MTDILIANMQRINVIAELLYEDLCGNPRAQVLAEIIIETSTSHTKSQQQPDKPPA